MDYRALAELVMLSSFGVSTLVFATGLSVRLFLAPTLRELHDRKSESEQELLHSHLAQVEERLGSIEASLERLNAADDFDRRLEGPKLG